MKAEEYIKQKSATIYSGGVNAEKVVSEKDALLALDATRNEMLDKACEWLEHWQIIDLEGSNIEEFISEFKKEMEE